MRAYNRIRMNGNRRLRRNGNLRRFKIKNLGLAILLTLLYVIIPGLCGCKEHYDCELQYQIALENAIWYPGNPKLYHVDYEAATQAANSRSVL